MAEVSNKYELVFILKADLGEETTTAEVEKYKSLIAGSGTVLAVDEWGKRRLAYLIDDLAEGYYVQVNFTSNKELPEEIYRQMKIDDSVIRSLITKKEDVKKPHGKKDVKEAETVAEAAQQPEA